MNRKKPTRGPVSAFESPLESPFESGRASRSSKPVPSQGPEGTPTMARPIRSIHPHPLHEGAGVRRVPQRASSFVFGALLFALTAGCVPPGSNKDRGDAASPQKAAPVQRASANVLRTPFEDRFDGPGTRTPSDGGPAPKAFDAGGEGGADGSFPHLQGFPSTPSPMALGPAWSAAGPGWFLEDGRLCGKGARNRGVWLERNLPTNARIDFDAVSYSPEGDIKAEIWGDGRSGATSISYSNATSYLVILGGWKNSLHVLARIDEHGKDRKEVHVDPASDDPRQRPVAVGQVYHFRIERNDGRKIRWWVDGNEMAVFDDPAPLAGEGHDHFGFNDWDAKVCFDNVKVVPL